MAYGKYYDAVAAGQVFIGSTAAAGTAFPITTGTAVTFGLWNTNPTKNAVLLTLDLGYTSGTIALGSLAIADQYCGFAIGTGAPLSAFTNGTPKNALLGNGSGSSMRFTPSAATLTAGGTAAKFIGKGIESATAGLGVFDGHYDFDGSIIVPPGHLVFLASSVAQTALFSASLMWAEVSI